MIVVAFIMAFFWILISQIRNYEIEIIITPITGLMVGALYDSEDVNELETEHIVQILFFIFSFNFIWLSKK